MHPSSRHAMGRFVRHYLTRSVRVLDVGSSDVNGTYRDLFAGHHYVGLDIAPGPNVDVVSPNLYTYPLADGAFDVVVSGQAIEHVQDLHAWIREVARVTGPGGLICIIGPWTWEQHRHPVDCWRVLPDGMRFLLEQVAGLDVLECASVDCDTIGVAQKPLGSRGPVSARRVGVGLV